MKITDNFLSDSEFKSIQDYFTGDSIHWYFNNSIAGNKQGLDQFQFVHTFYDVSKPSLTSFSAYLYPFLTKLNAKYIFRIKANLRPRTSNAVISEFHTDMSLNQQTAIFYINTNNGYTKFQDNTYDDVPSLANRFLTFSGQLKHAGASPTDTNSRIVLNVNYIPS